MTEKLYTIYYYHLDAEGKRIGDRQMGLSKGANEGEARAHLDSSLDVFLYPFHPRVKSIEVDSVEKGEKYAEILPPLPNHKKIKDEESLRKSLSDE